MDCTELMRMTDLVLSLVLFYAGMFSCEVSLCWVVLCTLSVSECVRLTLGDLFLEIGV